MYIYTYLGNYKLKVHDSFLQNIPCVATIQTWPISVTNHDLQTLALTQK